MTIARLLRHLFATHWMTRRCFDSETQKRIEVSITEVEALHGGEIRFAIETALDLPDLFAGLTSRHRALQVFGQLGVWDTAANNGVLIYVLRADRSVEIVADRGIGSRVLQSEWAAVCRAMEDHYRAGRFAEGSDVGVRGVGRLLAKHFPNDQGGRANELPNQPVLL